MRALLIALVLGLSALTVHGAGKDELRPAEHVDLIELNHYYDENGAHLLDQLIFYDWDSREERYNIRAWRLLKTPSQMPRPINDGYETRFREGSGECHVTSDKFQETWTQYDVELLERRNLPRELRKELFVR
jgi:hypothetical protein